MNDTTGVEVSNTDFLRAIFADVPDDARAVCCWFSGDPNDPPPGAWSAEPCRPGLTPLPVSVNDLNTFFAVSAFEPDEDGRTRRRVAQFQGMYCLVLDDLGTGVGSKIELAVDDLPLAPSWVLETSPGNFQVGYILEGPDRADLLKCVRLQDAMVRQGLCADTDPGMKGVTRYMRLPQGRNQKPKYRALNGGSDTGHLGFKHVTHEWTPERSYTIDEIVERFALVLDESVGLGGQVAGMPVLDEDADPVLAALARRGMLLGTPTADAWVDIRCPWVDEHTGRAESGTGYRVGGLAFQCHHGHCEGRTLDDLIRWLTADGESGLQGRLGRARAGAEFDEISGFEPIEHVPGAGQPADPFEGMPGHAPLVPVVDGDSDSARSASVSVWERNAISAETLSGSPGARAWCWDAWVPAGVVTGLAGPPGVSKSTFALQLCVHHVLGLPLLGQTCGPGPAVFITTEDDRDEVWRRLERITRALGKRYQDLAGLTLLPVTTDDPRLAWMTGDGQVGVTEQGQALWAFLAARRAQLLVLDLIFDFWDGGNENQRGPATAYIRGVLGRAASRHGFGVVGLAHPSVAAAKEGRAYAGSTAVLGSFRSGLSYTRRPDGDIDVELVKYNYTAPQPARVVRWQDGYLTEVTDIEQADAVLAAQQALWDEVLEGAFPNTTEWLGSSEVWQRLGQKTKNTDGADSWYQKRVERVLEEMHAGGALEVQEIPRSNSWTQTRRVYRRISPPDESRIDPFS